MLSPVLTLHDIARALDLSGDRALHFVERFEIPRIDVDGTLLVDAGICERTAHRTFGHAAGEAIHRARGGDPSAPFVVDSTPSTPPPDPLPVQEHENVEETIREALDAHGGVLSLPLYGAWATARGRQPLDKDTICRALGVETWAEALAYCGGRRGVTTPTDRAAALALMARAAADHPGRMTMDDYRDWARAHNARWLDPAKVARATGLGSWNAALAAAEAQNPDAVDSASGKVGDAT